MRRSTVLLLTAFAGVELWRAGQVAALRRGVFVNDAMRRALEAALAADPAI